jgi:hypothetical protein
MSLRLSVARVLWLAVAAAVSPLVLTSAAQAQAAPWTVVSSPDATPGNNDLAAVATVSASDVWAVGSAENSRGNGQLLAKHWNGTSWSIVSTPAVVTGQLSGLAAISSTDVWAAGSMLLSARGNTAQFLHWNGRKWTIVKSPATTAGIAGMAAVSGTDVWAVGSIISGLIAQTFIEHWNGKSWSIVPSPNDGTGSNLLNAVTAVSANDVWAVGQFQDASNTTQTLTEHWNGTSWSIVASPSAGAEFLGAAAVSSSNVWAVGLTGDATLIQHWNGASWAVVPSPNPSPAGAAGSLLFGVAVVSANDLWAVGESRNASGIPSTLIEQWNGTSWSIVASPSPGSAASLRGAAADSASGQAWAVGNFRAPSGADQTLIEFNP